VLYFKGTPEETLRAQLSIYSDWLPDSGFEPDNVPLMERYMNDARVDGYIEMEIYVKLKEI
jgi:AraC family transcriptional regulator